MAKIIFVPPHEIPTVFPDMAKFIQLAIDTGHGEIGIEDIYQHCLTGLKYLLVISGNDYSPLAAAITEISNYPKKRVIRVIMLGGKGMDLWCAELESYLVNWAKHIGATAIEVVGRKGWERQLKSYGYDAAYSYLVKEIK